MEVTSIFNLYQILHWLITVMCNFCVNWLLFSSFKRFYVCDVKVLWIMKGGGGGVISFYSRYINYVMGNK